MTLNRHFFYQHLKKRNYRKSLTQSMIQREVIYFIEYD